MYLLQSFEGEEFGEVCNFAVLLITIAFYLSERKKENIDRICEMMPKKLRDEMIYELEQIIINQAKKK